MIHYIPRKLNIIKRYIASEDQTRGKYTRREFTYNSKSHISLIQLKTIDFNKTKNINEESKTNPESEISYDNDGSPLSDSDQENLSPEFDRNMFLRKNNFNISHQDTTSPQGKNEVLKKMSFI